MFTWISSKLILFYAPNCPPNTDGSLILDVFLVAWVHVCFCEFFLFQGAPQKGSHFFGRTIAMAWRALNVGEDGTVFTEGQGPMSPMMALIMGRAQDLMAQREQEDADAVQQKKELTELTSETQKEVDKEVKDVKDGEKVGQEIEDGMGGKSSCPAASSSLTDIPQQKKKAPKKKKGKK